MSRYLHMHAVDSLHMCCVHEAFIPRCWELLPQWPCDTKVSDRGQQGRTFCPWPCRNAALKKVNLWRLKTVVWFGSSTGDLSAALQRGFSKHGFWSFQFQFCIIRVIQMSFRGSSIKLVKNSPKNSTTRKTRILDPCCVWLMRRAHSRQRESIVHQVKHPIYIWHMEIMPFGDTWSA